jgi:hypothetical protein
MNNVVDAICQLRCASALGGHRESGNRPDEHALGRMQSTKASLFFADVWEHRFCDNLPFIVGVQAKYRFH